MREYKYNICVALITLYQKIYIENGFLTDFDLCMCVCVIFFLLTHFIAYRLRILRLFFFLFGWCVSTCEKLQVFQINSILLFIPIFPLQFLHCNCAHFFFFSQMFQIISAIYSTNDQNELHPKRNSHIFFQKDFIANFFPIYFRIMDMIFTQFFFFVCFVVSLSCCFIHLLYKFSKEKCIRFYSFKVKWVN